MRIVIFAVGTHGDVLPNVVLGQALADAHHDVTIVTNPTFAPLVETAGLRFAPLTADFAAILRAERERLAGAPALVIGLIGLRRLRRMATGWVREAFPPTEGAGLIIGSGGALYLASVIAEARNIPYVRLAFAPGEPSRDIPPINLRPPRFRLPGAATLFLHSALRHVSWQFGRPLVARFRAELQLGPPPRFGPWRSPWLGRAPLIGAYSPQIVSRPSGWPANITITGYLRRQNQDPPAAELQRFLDAGPPPICIGFGSMIGADPARLSTIVTEAVRLTGRRAILLAGWGALAPDHQADPNILQLEHAPHDWLLPRTLLSVHHCGAGTTAAVLHAGIPSVAVPFMLDQFYWAARLHTLGVAPPHLDQRRVTAPQLADAIETAASPAMRARARELAASLATEDGRAGALAALRRLNLLPAAGA